MKKHGQWGTRLYWVWAQMIQRCTNPKKRAYAWYGADGITVCPEWRDFNNFYEWAMANGYRQGLSIDRKREAEGYSPDNCRWISMDANRRRANARKFASV